MDKEYDTKVNDKIFLNGYSSSAVFAQRFSLIHPEIIETACQSFQNYPPQHQAPSRICSAPPEARILPLFPH